MKYTITAKPTLDGKINLVEGFEAVDKAVADFEPVFENFTRRVIDSREQVVRDALIQLGWTPPPDK